MARFRLPLPLSLRQHEHCLCAVADLLPFFSFSFFLSVCSSFPRRRRRNATRSLLNKGGRDVMVDQTDSQSPAPSPTAASASASATAAPAVAKASKAAPRRFSIMTAAPSAGDLEKSRFGNFKRALLALPPSDTMRLMCEGRDFYVWQADAATGRVFRQMQHVYFVPAAPEQIGDPTLKLGALYWNAVGRKEDDPVRKLLISQLTDVYVGQSLSCQARRGSNAWPCTMARACARVVDDRRPGLKTHPSFFFLPFVAVVFVAQASKPQC